MKVGIIGAGFTGLSAAYYLVKKGVEVTVFEGEEKPGGLAVGFLAENWQWPLEKHYHHLFASDSAILNLAKEIGHEITFKRPVSATYLDGEIIELDSPLTLLTFRKLPFLDRIWTGVIVLYLKLTPYWQPLEKISAEKYIKNTMGEKSWQILWRPLFAKKFGEYADKIPASWFWARIKKRSASLGYPQGGFTTLAKNIEKAAKRYGAKFFYKTLVTSIQKEKLGFSLQTTAGKFNFDKIICTLPSFYLKKIGGGLPKDYLETLPKLKGLGAVNLILSLKQKFLPMGEYWLNINEVAFPFLAVVEHTALVDSKYYGGENLLYVGNYLLADHPYFKQSGEELLQEFLPYLSKINPDFNKSWVRKAVVFKAPFAQAVMPLNYSKIIPAIKTPVKGFFLANLEQVYPWDRGTNYAVELGEKAAKLLIDVRCRMYEYLKPRTSNL